MRSQWVTAHGRRIKVITVEPNSAPAARYPRYSKMSDAWAETLGKEHASGSTWATAHVLLREARVLVARGYKPSLKLTSKLLAPVRVGRAGKDAALVLLERLGLVSVERRPGKNPIVTVHFFVHFTDSLKALFAAIKTAN
jgi:hypothetical protein